MLDNYIICAGSDGIQGGPRGRSNACLASTVGYVNGAMYVPIVFNRASVLI
jgi:hypothetical protein